LEVSNFKHGSVTEGRGVGYFDHVVVGARRGIEVYCGVELHFDGGSMNDTGEWSLLVIALVRIVDIRESGDFVAGRVAAEGDRAAWEVTDN
jgi:hypothetical protein